MDKFKTFKYFLECYFNVSANYDELESLTIEFKTSESEKCRQLLVKELEEIQLSGDWDIVHEFVRLHGMRNMKYEKLKWLIQTMHLALTKK